MDVFTTAITWVYKLGIGVFPLIPKDKRPAAALLSRAPDGRGTWEPYKTTLPTPDELIRWFGNDGLTKPNIAIVTGWRGLVVLDFDGPGYYECWQAIYPQIETYVVTTARGAHVYFFLDNPPDRVIYTTWGEVRSAGAYVVGAPSIHPTGAIYTGNGKPIARVGALHDILSDALLEPAGEQPNPARVAGQILPSASTPRPTCVPALDPWQAASNPPGDPIDQVKQRYKVFDFVTGARQSGNGYYMALCPLHDDQSPSLSIDSAGEWCLCLAGCNRGRRMDVINLYARLHNLDDRAAIRELWDKIR